MQRHAMNRSGNSGDAEHPPPREHSTSTKRDAYLVMEKCGKGCMPAMPELCRTLRQARIVEAPQIPESEQLSQADGRIGGAGEVKMDLEREGMEPAHEPYDIDICPAG